MLMFDEIFSWCLVKILKMKCDQDLCLNLWYDPIGYFGKMNSTLGSVVPLAMFICKTFPKEQRTRGLSSYFKINLLGQITSSNTNLDQTSTSNLDQVFTSKSQPNITISTKLKFKILTKPSFSISIKIQLCNLGKTSAAKYWPTLVLNESLQYLIPI